MSVNRRLEINVKYEWMIREEKFSVRVFADNWRFFSLSLEIFLCILVFRTAAAGWDFRERGFFAPLLFGSRREKRNRNFRQGAVNSAL